MIGTNHCIEPPDAVFILDINGAIILEINSCLPPTIRVDNGSERRKRMNAHEEQLRRRNFVTAVQNGARSSVLAPERRTTEHKNRRRRQTCLRMPASCSRDRKTETHWKQMMGVIPDFLQRRTSQSTAKCRFTQRTSEDFNYDPRNRMGALVLNFPASQIL